jgi:hypothetical protein
MSNKNKIKEEELASIKEAINNSNQAKAILGETTTQAYIAQMQVLDVEKKLHEIQESLKEKYGSIILDINTGEYTVDSEEDNG